MIRFEKITTKNVYTVCQLSRTLSDNHKKMVADNAYSLAQAYVTPKAEPRAIYKDDQPVGFIMMHYGIEDDEPGGEDQAYLWRLMIATEHHGKGYGKAAMQIVFDEVIKHGYSELITSCGQGEGSPLEFYKTLGFEETGDIEHNELVLKVKLIHT
ncbi:MULTISPECIES: N-acetyltransferase [unclassified Fusibacter]|uniref:GNAT family N-acetyltransferase n=1 Tax=unclassified Fusibacter TaxID=2624464 RepID=UPI001010C652|nr:MULTISPECIES: GNAT family N-acetyltransferase [unclassified Fusibacter]MCK8058489.1 GNAT family N-acetyltransferase [Fusibacter sp. A2]NPE22742.1 GNAT family N-acetyltransferase [Fusibacter sp. A1]RXV60301.1 GNAT family N-acetyltransferase [Fusibacter sp. A1]